MTKSPWHQEPPLPGPEDGDEALDELSDDAIVAQQSAAHVHAPQPRAKVDVQEPSVVISEPEAAPPPAGPRRRGSGDKTLVIRDRRTVEEVRRRIKIENERHLRKRRLISLAVWIVAGLSAFGVGGLLALLATADDADADAKASAAESAVVELPHSEAPVEVLDLDERGSEDEAVPSNEDAEAVELDELPVEHSAPGAPEANVEQPEKPAPQTQTRKPSSRKRRAPAPQPKPESTIVVPF